MNILPDFKAYACRQLGKDSNTVEMYKLQFTTDPHSMLVTITLLKDRYNGIGIHVRPYDLLGINEYLYNQFIYDPKNEQKGNNHPFTLESTKVVKVRLRTLAGVRRWHKLYTCSPEKLSAQGNRPHFQWRVTNELLKAIAKHEHPPTN